MPKLPLFEDTPLHADAVEFLRDLFANPELDENMNRIDDLLDLHADPHRPMSGELACLMIDLGLLSGCMLPNFLFNTLDTPILRGKPRLLRLHINRWLLAHAAAAGFLPLRANRHRPVAFSHPKLWA